MPEVGKKDPEGNVYFYPISIDEMVVQFFSTKTPRGEIC